MWAHPTTIPDDKDQLSHSVRLGLAASRLAKASAAPTRRSTFCSRNLTLLESMAVSYDVKHGDEILPVDAGVSVLIGLSIVGPFIVTAWRGCLLVA